MKIVLDEPKVPGNIGAIARTMKNFSFKELILVNPQCDHLSKEALDRAKHAKEILKKAKIMKWEEVLKIDTIIATTSQLGTDYNINRVPISPEQLTQIIPNGNIGIVFGSEEKGLSNEKIKQCGFVTTIPTSKEYPTMNLSHSVAVMLYELSKKKGLGRKYHLATQQEKEILMQILNKILDEQYTIERHKETQRKVWQRMINKSFLTRREAFALIGLMKRL